MGRLGGRRVQDGEHVIFFKKIKFKNKKKKKEKKKAGFLLHLKCVSID